jgi:hypothetical protein
LVAAIGGGILEAGGPAGTVGREPLALEVAAGALAAVVAGGRGVALVAREPPDVANATTRRITSTPPPASEQINTNFEPDPWAESLGGEGAASQGEAAEVLAAAAAMVIGFRQRGHRTAVPAGNDLVLANLAPHVGQTTTLAAIVSTPKPMRDVICPGTSYQSAHRRNQDNLSSGGLSTRTSARRGAAKRGVQF